MSKYKANLYANIIYDYLWQKKEAIHRSKFIGVVANKVGKSSNSSADWGGKLYNVLRNDWRFLEIKPQYWTLREDPKSIKAVGEKLFWVVWGPNGKTNPKCRYYSKKSAETIARQMSLRHRSLFYVMEAKSSHETKTCFTSKQIGE